MADGMTSGPEPRYKYAKPGIKSQPGLPKHLGYQIEEYKLPAIDVQTERRNYPGYDEARYYTLDDILAGDISGSTETDSKTETAQKGYTKIYKKSGPGGRSTKRSATSNRDNTEKALTWPK